MRISKSSLIWGALYAIVASVLVALLVLIALGYLVLPQPPPATVTIEAVHWTILQGTTAQGHGWFGNSSFTWGAYDGYPATVRAGSSFEIPWAPSNLDTVSHTVYTVAVNTPFQLLASRPALPTSVPPGDGDDGGFDFDITIAGESSGSFTLNVTVNALSP
jgi:hypothetical protein